MLKLVKTDKKFINYYVYVTCKAHVKGITLRTLLTQLELHT